MVAMELLTQLLPQILAENLSQMAVLAELESEQITMEPSVALVAVAVQHGALAVAVDIQVAVVTLLSVLVLIEKAAAVVDLTFLASMPL
jgi:hypothetical protein